MDFKNFFYGNIKKINNKEIVLSSRFTENFTIKPITELEHIEIKRNSRKLKNGDIDINDYLLTLCCASVVVPDLKNQELQNSYNVLGDKNLLSSMLTAGEFSVLLGEVEKISLFEQNIEPLVNKLKKA